MDKMELAQNRSGGQSPALNPFVEGEDLETCLDSLRPLAEVSANENDPGDTERGSTAKCPTKPESAGRLSVTLSSGIRATVATVLLLFLLLHLIFDNFAMHTQPVLIIIIIIMH